MWLVCRSAEDTAALVRACPSLLTTSPATVQHKMSLLHSYADKV
jgi:hypothetical protein